MNKNNAINKVSDEEKKTESSEATSLRKKHSSMQMPRQVFQGKITAVFIFIVLIIVLAGLVWLRSYQQMQKPQTVVRKMTIHKQILQKRSKDLALIKRGLTGKAVDVNTGKIVKAARIFSPDDKTVYLELDLNSPPKGTVIDYIRYKDGRYVDHGEVALAKADIKNLLFNWTISTLLAHIRDGKWKVATYTNGILAKRVLYEIQNNKVGLVYPDEPISPRDPAYHLGRALSIVLKEK